MLAGVNGAGKSTVLDALAIALSWVIARVGNTRSSGRRISQTDIKSKSLESQISVNSIAGSRQIGWKLVKSRKGYGKSNNQQVISVMRMSPPLSWRARLQPAPSPIKETGNGRAEAAPSKKGEFFSRPLLNEQGHLCAFCMCRIKVESMKLAHWHSRTIYPEEQLDYRNLLGVCKGNEGSRREFQTCDTRQGNRNLKYNPANHDHQVESRIHYNGDGTINSDDPEFDVQQV